MSLRFLRGLHSSGNRSFGSQPGPRSFSAVETTMNGFQMGLITRFTSTPQVMITILDNQSTSRVSRPELSVGSDADEL